LPLYYWAHRFSESARLADYRYLLGRAKRVLIDSAVAPAGALTYPWPKPEILRDLVYARLLPVRQTVGQFLSGYSPAVLVKELQQVTVTHEAALAAEAKVLLDWLHLRLEGCGAPATLPLHAVPRASGAAEDLVMEFKYADPARHFRWTGNLGSGHALFEADFGNGQTKLPAAVSLLPPENALSEAMFF